MKTSQRWVFVTGVAAVLSAATIVRGDGTGGATSAPILVDTAPSHNRHWSTVFTNEVPLQWNWNAAATRAVLAITGMSGMFVTNCTAATSNCVWRVFDGAAPSTDGVYDLALTFYGDDDSVVGVLTSRLAVLKAAFGQDEVNTDTSDTKWATVGTDAVIPYDATWTTGTVDAVSGRLVIAKVNGATQTNTMADASGYFGWKRRIDGWGYGTFDLALTFPETEGEWDATLVCVPDGTMILMR